MDVDVVIVGGGPAGLQAALTLGRMRRSVVLVDSGEYRNAPASHMHNLATHDGRAPAEYRALARADIAAYDTVTLRDGRVADARREDDGIAVTLDDGDVVAARRLLLATGLRDTVPDVPGIAERFGTTVAHCPFCHGYELRGERVGVLGVAAAHVLDLMAPIAGSRTLLTRGEPLEQQQRDRLERGGVTIVEQEVVGVSGDDVAIVRLADGGTVELDSMFVTLQSEPSPLGARLGLTTLPSGCIEVDAMGRTSDPLVLAAGDGAHTAAMPMPMASVLVAAAAGQIAASSAVASLL